MSGHRSTADITAHNPFRGNRLGGDGPAVATAVVDGRTVVVEFDDGATSAFHHQWLRHCCWCGACGDPSDGIRFTTVATVDPAEVPAGAMTVDGDLVVDWPDGHRSTYGGDWLAHHAYDGASRTRRASWRPVLWRADVTNDFPTAAWADVRPDGGSPEALLAAYRLLRDFGILRIAGLGTEPSATEAVADLLGPIHETTVYGRIYDVRTEPVAKLGAKTGMPQAPHIDDAFAYSQPGIDVFHCLVNTDEGGLSTYVDGFAVAEAVRDEVPAAFDLLATVPVSHVRRHPGELEMRNRAPLVSLDGARRLQGIRYFDRALAPMDVDAELVEPMYDAVREFDRRMRSDEFRAELRVAPGDGMLIDNHRVLHGRTAFDPASGRHIRLCHVPRDEFHGRLRDLAGRLGADDHGWHLPQGSRV